MRFASIRGIAAVVSLPLAALPACAAERFVAPAAPADSAPTYARTCNAYGESYFALPDSDMCLAIGGGAIGQLELRSLPRTPAGPPAGARLPFVIDSTEHPAALGGAFAVGLTVAARLPTDAGLVSAYVSAMAGYGGSANPDNWANLTRLDLAYITFAGWTAGRAQSAFDFYADAWNFTVLRGSNTRTELFSYAFAPTPGVTAIVSVENPHERRGEIGQAVNPLASVGYQGDGAPDIVGALRVESPLGQAQISAAAHQLRTRYAAPASVAPGQPDAATSSQWGFAAQGGLKVNLPSLSDADAMILQATYARGASAYVAGDSQSTFGDINHPGIASPRLTTAPGLAAYDYDCVVAAQPFGRCDRSSGYAIVAALKHFWSPEVSSSLFASVFGMSYPDAVKTGQSGVAGAGEYRESIVGGNLVWTPLKNLMIGGEISYALGQTETPSSPSGGAGEQWTTSTSWSGRVRVQQKF
ncbi:hypothetical protein GGD83_000324 [Rhodoblastus sphagnicola]|nr:porin [Rhodoblastus sphagnicola]MBB4196553.1 hypothetical protein [Rhodoblastus sphagnicola]